jgi:hypothetical protein
MRTPSPISAGLRPLTGGIAPQQSAPTGFKANAAAHLPLLGLFVASVLFVASLIVASSAINVVFGVSVASTLPAYPASVRPIVVCNLVSMECTVAPRRQGEEEG